MLAPPPQDQHRRHASSPTDRSNESNGATSSTARTRDDERIDHNKHADASHHAKHLDSSKDVALDAQVMQRRWERALGVAVREGQARREIADRSSGASVGALKREAAKRGEQADLDSIHLRSAGDYFTNGTDGHQTYAVTDNVTDDDFNTALDEARAEGNVSRANVIRKIKEANGTAPAFEPTRHHENMR